MTSMKILIVGKNSFVGQGVGARFVQKEPAPQVDYLSVRDDAWQAMDLSGYDTVIFTAALVHRPDVTDWEQYEKINVMLPWEFAKQAKAQGVRQFIFFSTVSVYAAERALPAGTVITAGTPLAPPSMYGKSKLLAEEKLQTLIDDSFHVSIIRPTYVYGKGCRGRHIEVQQKLTKYLPVLPKAFEDVKMGMVYIDNLAELTWLIANSDQSGICHAQDKAPLSTYEILQTMTPKKKTIRCQWLLRLFSSVSVVERLFGGSAYSEEMASCDLGEYQIVSMADGIRRTVD